MKKGFTLAEMLVTLGIVGVVAALTLPTLFEDASGAQIGPSLAKAVSTFEQATKSLLTENDINAISDLDLVPVNQSMADLFFDSTVLGGFLNLSAGDAYSASIYDSSLGIDDFKFNVSVDGIAYSLQPDFNGVGGSELPHRQWLADCFIDINGKKKPNVMGEDLFVFMMMNDGSLIPYGENGDWKTYCAIGEIPEDPKYCAGHVFENNLKVLYK